MEKKITPGPWFVDQYGHVYGWDSADGERYIRESVLLLDNRHSKATRADKNLIAAAPDLLAALESIWEYLDKHNGNYKEVRAAGYAAIAKAKGE